MNWHSQGGVSYLPAGFDATVSDSKDMVFRNILPFGPRVKLLIDILVMPVLEPVQKLVRHSIIKCFGVDISPYILLIILSYFGNICEYLQR